MSNHSRLTYIPHLKENLFAVNSSELADDIAFIRANKITNLNLFGSLYALNHVDWLEDVSEQVEKLFISTPSKGGFSFAGLRFCKNLKDLTVRNYTNGLIDLSHNLGIESVSVEDSKSLVGLEKLGQLKSAVFNKLPLNFQTSENFLRLQKLEYLCVSSSEVSSGISFLENTNLKKLFFYACKQLNIAGIEKIGLKELKIEKSKNVQCFKSIFNATSLTQLSLIDSDNIPNAETVFKLHNLKVLIVLGSSRFIDGNIAELSRRLDVFNFDNKKHYDIKWAKNER